MKSELTVKTDSFKLYVSVGLCLTVIVIFLSVWFAVEMSIILCTVAGIVALSGVGVIYDRYSTIRHARQMSEIDLELRRQTLRQATAEADKAELYSHIFTMSHTERALVTTGFEYHVIDAMSDSGRQLSQPQLTAPAMSLDLLRIFTQPTQSYAIIGGQQVGKTYQARRIAQYWLDSGIKPIVVGPKWDKGEWACCALFGGEYNFERVSQGMRIIKRLAEDRHASSKGHKEHPVQPIFFDDWTAIRAKLERDAEDFIIDATTLYASVNVILYFIIHLDTANAWGVGRIGAALHQNFIKLLIKPGFDSDGMIDRSRNIGMLIMPGQQKRDARQVQLFAGIGQPVALPVEPDLVISPREQQDAEFVRLVRDGMSRNEASRAAYGRPYGGDLVERGKRALGEI